MTTTPRKALAIAILATLATGCATDRAIAPDADGGVPQTLTSTWSEWSEPVNLGPVVNSAFVEQGTAISKDGRSLYFQSDRPGGSGGFDIYVSQRACTDDGDPTCAWGAPQNLGPTLNSAAGDNAPKLSPDEHWLYFNSGRPGGFGGGDIWVSRRRDRQDDFGWETPINVGSGVNTEFLENQPEPFDDGPGGTQRLYFTSNRPGGLGLNDIYVSVRGPDGTFGPPSPVTELNTAADDLQPEIRRDGLELFMGSSRPGGFGLVDLYVSTRQSVGDAWSAPVNLGAVLNGPVQDARPAISWDGTTLYFQSPRPGGFGGFDLYRTTRSKATKP